MPASLTRKCAGPCQSERPIAEFRDEGDVTRGRPPKVCRYCRAKDERLQRHHARNRARRPHAVVNQRAYAARSEWEVFLATIRTHPAGYKVCPEVAGCGQALPIEAFTPNRYQQDGLEPLCDSCNEERHALRRGEEVTR